MPIARYERVASDGAVADLSFSLRAVSAPVKWPVSHYDAYSGGYAGLIKKGLITGSADGHGFTITNAGLKAMAKPQ
jgi:hypothetical protein